MVLLLVLEPEVLEQAFAELAVEVSEPQASALEVLQQVVV